MLATSGVHGPVDGKAHVRNVCRDHANVHPALDVVDDDTFANEQPAVIVVIVVRLVVDRRVLGFLGLIPIEARSRRPKQIVPTVVVVPRCVAELRSHRGSTWKLPESTGHLANTFGTKGSSSCCLAHHPPLLPH